LGRLHTLLDGRAALVLALPGPLTRARTVGDRSAEALEVFGAELLEAAKELEPQRADCVAVVERTAVGRADVEPLEESLAPLWNAARYYASASMLLAEEGVPELGDTAADAVAAWAGASPHELAARGARHVGCPVCPAGTEATPKLPELPDGGFYTSAGELPVGTEIEALHRLIDAVAQVGA
jgi:hypothetical protein